MPTLKDKVRELATMKIHRDELIQYLRMKAYQEDWHGVSDAANDLRVLEAQTEARTCQL